MLVVGLLATIFWDAPALHPFKLLVVLIHEMWHGFTALIAGASLDRITLNWEESGETVVSGLHSGGGFFISVCAGYLGSAFTGGALLNRGLHGRFERVTLLAFASLLLYMSFLFTDIGSVAFFTGSLWALLLFLPLFSRIAARYCLVLLGTLFVWYCFYDMFDFTRDILKTDAGILANYLRDGSPALADSLSARSLALIVSVLWCFIILTVIALLAYPALRPLPSQVPPAPPPPVELIDEFPGELSEEVQDWFLRHGLGPDGQQLPQELFELKSAPPPKDMARPAAPEAIL